MDNWPDFDPQLRNCLLQDAISTQDCLGLVLGFDGFDEEGELSSDLSTLRLTQLMEEAFSESQASASAVRVLGVILSSARLWRDGSSTELLSCASLLLRYGEAEIKRIASQVVTSDGSEVDLGLAAPSKPLCLLLRLLWNLASLGSAGLEHRADKVRPISLQMQEDIQRMLLACMSAPEAVGNTFESTSRLCVLALWQLLFLGAASKDNAALAQLPQGLQEAGLNHTLCPELEHIALTTEFQQALDIAKNWKCNYFHNDQQGDKLPDDLYDACIDQEQLEANMAAYESECARIMMPLDDAILGAGTGLIQKDNDASLEALQNQFKEFDNASRSAFAALMWHVEPLALLEDPEEARKVPKMKSKAKLIMMQVQDNVTAWLQEHLSASTGLEGEDLRLHIEKGTRDAQGIVERAVLMLELHSSRYLELADPKQLETGAGSEIISLLRTDSYPGGRLTRVGMGSGDQRLHLERLRRIVSGRSQANEGDPRKVSLKAVISVLLPQGQEATIDTTAVREALKGQQEKARTLMTALDAMAEVTTLNGPKADLAASVLLVLSSQMNRDGWLHPEELCIGCGLLVGDAVRQQWHKLVAHIIGRCPDKLAQIATLWKPADLKFVAALDLPSRLLQVASQGSDLAPHAWKLVKSLVLLVAGMRPTDDTRLVQQSVVNSVLDHLEHCLQSSDLVHQRSELERHGNAPFCLLALMLPPEIDETEMLQTLATHGGSITTFDVVWIKQMAGLLLRVCLTHPGWELAQGSFALVLRVLRQLTNLESADEIARDHGFGSLPKGRMLNDCVGSTNQITAETALGKEAPPGSVMIALLAKLSFMDDQESVFSEQAREVFSQMAQAAIPSLRQARIMQDYELHPLWQPAIDHFVAKSMGVALLAGMPRDIPIDALKVMPELATQLHDTSLSLKAMGGQPTVIRSGTHARGPSGLVLVTHYELGDKSSDVLVLPKLNSSETLEITALEPVSGIQVLGTHVKELLQVVGWHVKQMLSNEPMDDRQCVSGAQQALAIKALATHMTQLPEITAEALAEHGLAWELMQVAQDAQLAGKCNIDDSIQVLELLAYQVLLPIATGHDSRAKLGPDILAQLASISYDFNCPYAKVQEMFEEQGGLDAFQSDPSGHLNKVRNVASQYFMDQQSVQSTELDPELLSLFDSATSAGRASFLSGESDLSAGLSPGLLVTSTPVREETAEELGMQSIPVGVGKLELSEKHLLIQKLLGSEEEVWRTSAQLFLARIYRRLANLYAIQAASQLMRHWPASIVIDTSKVGQVLMLIYRCVACGMGQDGIMGSILSILARKDSSETTVELIRAAFRITNMHVHATNNGENTEAASLNVALAILSAASRQIAADHVAQELLTRHAVEALITVAHVTVGSQRREAILLLQQVVSAIPDAIKLAGSAKNWTEMFAGLRNGLSHTLTQSQSGSLLGSLSLQSYAELFLSYQEALRRSEPPARDTLPIRLEDVTESGAVSLNEVYCEVTAPTDLKYTVRSIRELAAELSEGDRALGRFITVADAATALLEGRALPKCFTLGVLKDGLPPTCPRCGKDLAEFYTTHADFTCDVCSVKLPLGSRCYSCRDCDFDMSEEIAEWQRWLTLVEVTAAMTNDDWTHPELIDHNWSIVEVPLWSFEDHQQLAACLDSFGANLFKLPSWADQDLTPFPRLEGKPVDELVYYSRMLVRFSKLMMSVLPMLDLFSKEERSAKSAAIRKMRSLILGYDKTELVAMLLGKCKNATTGNQQPGGGRGAWLDLHIDRLSAAPGNSIFKQVFDALREADYHTYNDMYRGTYHGQQMEQIWYMHYKNERAIDYGGVFRETFSNLGPDLCSENNDLFIPVPNSSGEVEAALYQDCWMPNPSCQAFDQYEFLGRLMAYAILSDESLLVALPPMIWKQIAGFKPDKRDMKQIDAAWVSSIEHEDHLDISETLGAELWELSYESPWKVDLSNKVAVELRPSALTFGAACVTYAERFEWVNQCWEARLAECEVQVDAIRRGVTSIIPIQVLKLWTSKQLETAVCGEADIPVDALKASVEWDDISPDAEEVQHFWSAVERLENPKERSLLIQFISGRSRLPCKLKIARKFSSAEDYPFTHTCFYTIDLPPWRDAEVAYERIRYAIYNCMEIDGD